MNPVTRFATLALLMFAATAGAEQSNSSNDRCSNSALSSISCVCQKAGPPCAPSTRQDSRTGVPGRSGQTAGALHSSQIDRGRASSARATPPSNASDSSRLHRMDEA